MEVLGDRWSLVVLRDLIFGSARSFNSLHRQSLEGIATNVLASRLDRMVETGLVTRHGDPNHRQRVNYHLTESAIQLVPVLATLGEWGARWLPVEETLVVRARVLAEGGPQLWERFMDELRAEHLGAVGTPDGGSVRAMLDHAYLEATSATST